MSSFFQPKVRIRPNLFEFLTRKRHFQNYEIEVNNLLADNRLLSITQAQVSSITMRQSADTLNKSEGMMISFYTLYLRHCIKDKYLTREALVELNHLKHILSLSEREVGEINEKVIGAAYQRYVDEALLGNQNSNEKTLELNTTKQDSKLSPELKARIQQQVKEKYLQNFYDQPYSDESLSPEEEDQLDRISRHLNIELGAGDRTKHQLDKYKLYWVIENGTLPETKCSLFLEVGERCYFKDHCKWHEYLAYTRSEESRSSLKVSKGDRYIIGSNQNILMTEMQEIDCGTLYLTNHRIIFTGKSSIVRIKLNKIQSFEPFIEGIRLNREAGQSPFIGLERSAEVLSLILSRLLSPD
jgi:hypothetical protein